MPRVFRIHGDNIVECERLLNIIINETQPHRCEKSLISPSTICVDLEFTYAENEYSWRVELLPGFNKAVEADGKEIYFLHLKKMVVSLMKRLMPSSQELMEIKKLYYLLLNSVVHCRQEIKHGKEVDELFQRDVLDVHIFILLIS